MSGFIFILFEPTYDFELDEDAGGRVRGHLALVEAGVPRLNEFNLQPPILQVTDVLDEVSPVSCVRRQSHCQ